MMLPRCNLTSRTGHARLARLAWAAPFLLHATDGYAWGLYTHTYFAQLLIWSIPLADPRFRRALSRFPELFLAATCLPDISLFSRLMRTPETGVTHQWAAAIAMLRDAQHAAERAMALGYATHLLTDVVAHSQFVPAHESMWFRAGMLTHAASEWAMDAHVTQYLFVRPAMLVSRHEHSLSAFAEDRLGITRTTARRALSYLLRGERLLRKTRIPQLIYAGSRRVDPALSDRLDDYVRETSLRLRQVNRLVAGDVPAWTPEIEMQALPRGDAPALPGDLFCPAPVGN